MRENRGYTFSQNILPIKGAGLNYFNKFIKYLFIFWLEW